MKNSLSVCLVKCGALIVVVGLLSFGSGPMAFTAGAESNCTQDEENGSKCDKISNSECVQGVNKCKSGNKYSSCEDGGGSELKCTDFTGCGGGPLHYVKSNSTGC